MIMAAGLGKRMRPLTATKPKPLIEVGGKALLDHVLEKLRAAGVKKVVVNVHYLAGALEAHLASREHGLEVVISDERDLLMETGGGLVKAAAPDRHRSLPRAQQRQSVDRRAGRHAEAARLALGRSAKMDALLLLVPQARALNHKGIGDFHMDRTGRLRRREEAMSRRSSSPASRSCPNACSAMRPRARSRPTSCGTGRSTKGRCFGAVHQGLWFDVGTPQSIQLTETALEHV